MEEKIVALLEHEGVQIESCLTPEEIEEISTDPDKYVTVFQRQLRANEQVQSSVNSKSSKFWTTSSVKLLLSIRLGMEDQFNSPTCKKMKLWDDISKQMIEMGINVNGNDCYSKYRNLLQTYRSNKERSMKTGEGRIQWEFFVDFDAVLGNKASTIPPANILSTSLNQTEETHRENSEELLTVLPVSERALSLPEDVSQQSKKNIKKKVVSPSIFVL